MKSTYPYTGLPLSPAIAEALILDLFSGQAVQRQEIVDSVLATHLERGGNQGGAVDTSRTVKKALESLRDKQCATNPSQRFWRIAGELPPSDSEATLPLSENADPRYDAEVTYGEGSGAVYVYYLPPYELLAKAQGHNTWLCKIGRSERDPALRVLSQAGTALPETPRFIRLIRTDQPSVLEIAIHSILKLRGRHSADSPGNEWFHTSPNEIDEICSFLGIHVQG